jgi:hypothetical protein
MNNNELNYKNISFGNIVYCTNESKIKEILNNICKNGNLQAFVALHEKLNFSKKFIIENNNSFLYLSLTCGHLKIGKWLQSTFHLTKNDIEEDYYIFVTCCGNNRNQHDIYNNYDNCNNCNNCYNCNNCHNCYNDDNFINRTNQLKILKWYYKTFQITKEDLKKEYFYYNIIINDAILNACKYGNLNICEWLHKKFTITKKEITQHYNKPFREACKNGYINICQWIYFTFSLTTKDARMLNNYALRCAYNDNHFEVVEFLFYVVV